MLNLFIAKLVAKLVLNYYQQLHFIVYSQHIAGTEINRSHFGDTYHRYPRPGTFKTNVTYSDLQKDSFSHGQDCALERYLLFQFRNGSELSLQRLCHH